jgi:hypothetical protein
MKNILFIGALFFLSSCTRKLILTGPCTEESIIAQCKNHFKKDYGEIIIGIEENDSLFIVKFGTKINYPNNREGGYIEILKNTCKIKAQVYYQ